MHFLLETIIGHEEKHILSSCDYLKSNRTTYWEVLYKTPHWMEQWLTDVTDRIFKKLLGCNGVCWNEGFRQERFDRKDNAC